jgi:hypothetical protein
MKAWLLIIGILVIFAMLCSPVLAISKSDLISQSKGQSIPAKPTPTPLRYDRETTTFDNTILSGYYPKIAQYLYTPSEAAVEHYQQGPLYHSLYPVPGWAGNVTDYLEKAKSFIELYHTTPIP